MRKNGVRNYLAHESVIICRFRGDATGNGQMLMFTVASPWFEIVSENRVVGNYSPGLLNKFVSVGEPEGTSVNRDARKVERCNEVQDFLLCPT